MRWIDRLLGFSLLLILLWLMVPWGVEQASQWQIFQKKRVERDNTANIRTMYELDNQGLRFSLINQPSHIRISTIAALDGAYNLPQDFSGQYQLSYQLLDNDDQVLYEQDYYHKTSSSLQVEVNGRIVPSNYIENQARTVLAGQNFVLDLRHQFSQAKTLVLKLESTQAPIEKVYSQVAFAQPRSDEEIYLAWRGQSAEQKQRMAEFHVHNTELFSASEIQRILRYRYKSQGPEGFDYQQQAIHSLFSIEPANIYRTEQATPLSAILLDSNRKMNFVIAEGGQYQLDAQSLADADDVVLSAVFMGKNGEQIPLKTGQLHTLPEGVISIEANSAASVQLWQHIGNNQVKVGISNQRKYALQHNQVAYQLNYQAPVKLAFHSALVNQTVSVSYQILNSEQSLVEQGQLSFNTQASMFDRLANEQLADNGFSQLVERYLNNQYDHATLLLSSQEPIWVSAASRPKALPLVRRIPEDEPSHLADENRINAWFSIEPSNSEALIANNQSAFIQRPFQFYENPAWLSQQEYYWQDLINPGVAIVNLLTEVEANERANQSQYFSRLPASDAWQVNLQGERAKLNPLLLINAAEASWVTINITSPVSWQSKVFVQAGLNEIALPSVATGELEFGVNGANEVEVFINHCDCVNDTRWLKRRALRIDNEAQFTFTLEPQQLLSLKAFSEQASDIALTASLNASREEHILEEWSFLERRYLLNGQYAQSVAVINDARQLFAHQGVSLSVNSDLQTGQQVVLTIKVNQPIWLQIGLFSQQDTNLGEQYLQIGEWLND